jgi:hypothetical protein
MFEWLWSLPRPSTVSHALSSYAKPPSCQVRKAEESDESEMKETHHFAPKLPLSLLHVYIRRLNFDASFQANSALLVDITCL